MALRLYYHWSPTERRTAITEHGLQPGHPSTDKAWNPPHLCFSDSPSYAWGASAAMSRGAEHPEWDLWCVWLDDTEVWAHPDGRTMGPMPGEYRTEEYLPADRLWYVGTRSREPSLVGR